MLSLIDCNFDPFPKITSFKLKKQEKALFLIISTFFGILIFSNFDDENANDLIE